MEPNANRLMLKVTELTSRIGHNPVLQGVTFDVAAGSAVALMGPNGAGKTTLLRTISGLLRPTGGTIMFDETHDIGGNQPWDIVRLGISHVPQGRRCFGPLSVYDNLKVGAYTERQAFPERLEQTLALFPELKVKLRAAAATLSGGQQQMLAIARALMSKPRLLMLDEPSLGLAPFYVHQVGDFLRRLRQFEGLTVVIVEQNLSLVQAVAEEYYLLRSGRTVSAAIPVDQLDEEELARAYLSALTGPN